MGRQSEEFVFNGISALKRGKPGGRAAVGMHGQLSNRRDPVLAQYIDVVASRGGRLIAFDLPGYGDYQGGKASSPMATGLEVRAFVQLTRSQPIEVDLLASGIGPTPPCAIRPLGRSSVFGWRLHSLASNTGPGRNGRVFDDG